MGLQGGKCTWSSDTRFPAPRIAPYLAVPWTAFGFDEGVLSLAADDSKLTFTLQPPGSAPVTITANLNCPSSPTGVCVT